MGESQPAIRLPAGTSAACEARAIDNDVRALSHNSAAAGRGGFSHGVHAGSRTGHRAGPINQRWLLVTIGHRVRGIAPLPKWRAASKRDELRRVRATNCRSRDVVGDATAHARCLIRFHGARIAELYGRVSASASISTTSCRRPIARQRYRPTTRSSPRRLPVYTVADMRDAGRTHRPLRAPAASVQQRRRGLIAFSPRSKREPGRPFEARAHESAAQPPASRSARRSQHYAALARILCVTFQELNPASRLWRPALRSSDLSAARFIMAASACLPASR